MATDFWADNMYASRKETVPHFIVDLGYVNHPAARDNCDCIVAMGVERRNIQIVTYGRLLIRIPPSQLAAVLKRCPDIQKKTTYSWVTHSWIAEDADNLKYCMS